MLLSGTDNHIAGLGNMGEMLTPEQRGKPGYEGHLNNRVVSLAEVLRTGGLPHLHGRQMAPRTRTRIFPHARGFERSFSMLFGGASYWSDMFGMLAEHEEVAEYVMDDKRLEELPKDFYATRSYTDFLIESIRENRGDGKPFLAYLAFTVLRMIQCMFPNRGSANTAAATTMGTSAQSKASGGCKADGLVSDSARSAGALSNGEGMGFAQQRTAGARSQGQWKSMQAW